MIVRCCTRHASFTMMHTIFALLFVRVIHATVIRERMLASSVTAKWTYTDEHLARFQPQLLRMKGHQRKGRDGAVVMPLPPLLTPSFDYNTVAENARAIMVDRFFGPAATGVYSPSVQYTMHKMAAGVVDNVGEVAAVTMSMPNIHFLPMNNEKIGIRFEDDVFVATSEPHGTIAATVTRQLGKSTALEGHPTFPMARL